MPPPEGEGEQAGSLTSNEATPDHSDQPSMLSIGVGTASVAAAHLAKLSQKPSHPEPVSM